MLQQICNGKTQCRTQAAPLLIHRASFGQTSVETNEDEDKEEVL